MDEAVGGPLLSPPQHFSVDGDAISTFSWDSLKKKINGMKPLVPGGKMENQCGAEQGNVSAAVVAASEEESKRSFGDEKEMWWNKVQ